jgi:uncharacterized protein (TIGR02265 family)
VAASFQLPDFEVPLDLETRLDEAPEDGRVKGMFFQSILEQVAAAGASYPTEQRYFGFKDYPLRDFLRILGEAAPLAHPGESPREALRRVGRQVYPTFVQSMVGKVLFGMVGDDFSAALSLAGKAYRISQTVGSAEVGENEAGRAIIHLRDVWAFPDAYQVGIYEGGLDVFGLEGEVRVRLLSSCDADLEVRWQPREG